MENGGAADGSSRQGKDRRRGTASCHTWIADRVGEPLGWPADDADVAYQVRPDGVGEPGKVNASGKDVDGIAGLRLNYGRELPSLEQSVTLERQVVDSV